MPFTKEELEQLKATLVRPKASAERQEKALRMLLTGKTVEEVAKAFEVSTNTLSKWRKDALRALEEPGKLIVEDGKETRTIYCWHKDCENEAIVASDYCEEHQG